jgi:hypothetical protein
MQDFPLITFPHFPSLFQNHIDQHPLPFPQGILWLYKIYTVSQSYYLYLEIQKKIRSKDCHQLAAFFFQKAAIAALKDVFEPTGTAIQGCYFHFTQAVWRKIRSVRYLAKFQ